jgi:L-fuconolactonase
MDRRIFLGAAATAALSSAAAPAVPIIDTHIHLFDPTRPQGVPWPEKTAPIYMPALPDRYRQLVAPLGVTGAIVVEASPWLEDNQWVLDVAANAPIIVGTIGNLEPGAPEFGRNLERFHRNPLFKGIRNGNLWGRNLGDVVSRPEVIADLKLMADAGLTLDTANPSASLMEAVVRVTDKVPGLRVVLDHLPQLAAADRGHLRELGQRRQVFAKLSAVYRKVDGQIPRELSVYRSTLDELMAIFGEDRVLYGSDWPNSDRLRPYPDVLSLVQEYFATKSRAAAEKYFWKNSVAAYRWTRRESAQPGAEA